MVDTIRNKTSALAKIPLNNSGDVVIQDLRDVVLSMFNVSIDEAITSVTSSYTTLATDSIILVNEAAPSLPVISLYTPPSGIPGKIQIVKNRGNSNITINTVGPDLIDDSGSMAIVKQYGFGVFRWNGTNWDIIGGLHMRPDNYKATEVAATRGIKIANTLTLDQTFNAGPPVDDMESHRFTAPDGFSGNMIEVNGQVKTTDATHLRANVWGTTDGDWGLNGLPNEVLTWGKMNLNAVGFKIEDRTGNASVNLHAGYCGIACKVQGNTEKGVFFITAIGCDQGIVEDDTGGTPDTNTYYLTGQIVRRIFTCSQDAASKLVLNMEAARDLGQDITLSDTTVVPDPRIYISTGKASTVGGQYRGHNGRLFILVDRDSGFADGSDTFFIENLICTDGMYGKTLWARRVHTLNGHLTVRRGYNGRSNYNETGSQGEGTIQDSVVRLDQVQAGDFHCTLTQVRAQAGIYIGDAALGYFPKGWGTYGNIVIMDTYNSRTSTFPTAGSFPSPTNRYALNIEKMEDGVVHFKQIEGDINLQAACTNVDIIVQSDYLANYTVTAHTSATYRLIGHDGSILQRNAGVVSGVESGITASTTQTQGQQPLTKKLNEISVVANANDAATMPAATGDGDEVTIINNGVNTLQLFPETGDDMGAGVDTAVTLAAGSSVKYVDYNATNWKEI